ncbi:hypothetical protein F5888DRAFT_1619322 [Russula emetica]|nr:hypothetical protein F5888DRAFT_1619322 [Russula emetica]
MSIEDTITTESTESTKAVNHTPRLPPELWLIIFRFATSSPITYPPPPPPPAAEGSTTSSYGHSYYYEPFQSPRHETTIIALSDAAVRDRCAITLVCRQWRALAGDMRYEDIRIGRGIAALHAALSELAADTETDTTSSPPRPSCHRVRRVVLPYAHTATPTYHPPPALALLALLPHLEVLVRPPISPLSSPLSSPPRPPRPSSSHRRTLIPITTTHSPHFLPTSPRFEFPTAAPALPALRRLEWAFDKTGAAARAGGINSLTDMLKAAPSISELVLTGLMPHSALRQDRVPLRSLRTLRFRAGACGCPFINLQTSYWVMPALENIVVEGGGRAKAFEELWGTFGGQVRLVELELGGEAMWMDDVGEIVNACPELEELNFRIGCVHLNKGWSPRPTDDNDNFVNAVSAAYVHDALQRLGICIDVDSDPAPEGSVKTWMALAEFVGEWKLCPALRQVVLYVRDVQVAEQNPQFHLFHEELASSGRQLLLRSVRT